MTVRVIRRTDLDPAAIDRIARGERVDLRADLTGSRAATLRDLAGDAPVYGVTTGMGALSGVRLTPTDQARHQNTLMVGRAVGSAPWLSRPQARALMAARLRTLLHPAAGVSTALCAHIAALLNADVIPAIPARGSGAAGEIIPLAHAGAALNGTGEFLDGPTLADAGIAPRGFEAKEGVAFLQGVPGLTGTAILAGTDVRLLLSQVTEVAAAEQVVIGASRDPLHPALADGDPELARVLDAMRTLRGDSPARALQAPVSFRVTAPALAVALRARQGLDAAATRALDAVTDSPAHLGGHFVGTAGFAGTDLVAAAGTLTTALIHLAELGAARLHRLLDDHVTGLPRQLSEVPGLHAGMAAVHKRAAGVVHRARRFAPPALIGAVETSLGQEDVQSFGFEAIEGLNEAIDSLREVLACEFLAVHQAQLLSPSTTGSGLGSPLGLPPATADRPFGRDLDVLVRHLRDGWGTGALWNPAR